MEGNGDDGDDITVAYKYLASSLEPHTPPIAWRVAEISTTNLAACVSSKFDQFLPERFYFVSKRPENFVRIAKFPYAAFGPLFAFHCPLFVTKNNNLGWNRHRRFATHRNMQVQRSRPTVLSARGQ